MRVTSILFNWAIENHKVIINFKDSIVYPVVRLKSLYSQ